MLLLTTASDKIQVVTAQAVTVDVHASAIDKDSAGVITEYRLNTKITTATTTDVVASPAGTNKRNVKTLSIRNVHATLAVTVTVRHTDGTTIVELMQRVLYSGDVLAYGDQTGWSDADGGFFTNTGAAMDLASIIGDPTTPPAETVRLFGRLIAGGNYPAYIGSSGLSSALQPLLARNKLGYWNPPGNAVTLPGVFGLGALTATGTVTTRTVAVTNHLTQMKRLGYVSVTTAGGAAGNFLPTAQFWRGNYADGGGFLYVCRFGVSDGATVANSRMYVGMYSVITVIGNVEPNTLVNILGVGSLAGQTNLSIMHNDGAGVATMVDLGANFPCQTLSVDPYEVAVFCPPNALWVGIQVTRLSTGHVESRILSTNIPAQTQLLTFHAWRNNGATALAVGLDICSHFIMTDL